ncbi:MAG: carboxypeptidase regulatory-like domain-containing protein [Myxococcales bacterium]|nr:carboxypeptidase regulatory-like domain-containing protein [Myxococcales bacterium]
MEGGSSTGAKVIVISVIGAAALWWVLADDAVDSSDAPGEVAGEAGGHEAAPRDSGGLRARAIPSNAAALLGAPRASIRGTIRDQEGRSIAGAQVCALPRSPILPTADKRSARCVTSEADGAYRLELLGVNHRVSASAPNFIPAAYARGEGARREVVLWPGLEATGIDITLRGGGVEITGVVKDLSGGAIEGAQLRGGDAIGFTGEEGRFALWVAPGERLVQAWAEGYANGGDEGSAPGHAFEIFLTPEAVLIGQVVRAGDGSPVEGATVSAIDGESGWSDAAAITDVAGEFRIGGLQPGAFKPSVVGDDVRGEADEQVILGLGETSAPLTVTAHPAFSADGEVAIVGEGGSCAAGSVALHDRANDRRVESELDGGGARLRGLFPGTYQVTVRCRGYVSASRYEPVMITDASVDGLRWEVTPGQAIRGRVIESRGAPASGVRVGARPRKDVVKGGGQLPSPWFGDADEAGRFEITGLLAGDYELDVNAWAPKRATPKDPIPVTLADGHDVDDLTITLPAGGELRGRIVDSEGQGVRGATLALEDGPAWRTCAADDQGAFACAEVLPGSYRVLARLGLFGEMRTPGRSDDDVQGEEVEIREGEVTEIKLVVEAATGVIHGVVRDADGGPVADAFVATTRESAQHGGGVQRSRWGRWASGRHPVLSDADGRFTLSRLAPGEYTILAQRRGGGEAFVEHAAIGEDVVLTIADAGRLGGRVTLAGGGVPEEFTVTIRDHATGFHRSDAFLRTDGAFSLPDVPAGRYEVRVSAGVGVAEVEATMPAGEDLVDLQIELMAIVTVRGRIVDEEGQPVAGMEVDIAGGRGGRFRGSDEEGRNVSDRDGRFEVERAPSGKVQITVRAPSGDEFGWTSLPAVIEPSGREVEVPPIEVIRSRIERGGHGAGLGFTVQRIDPDGDPLGRRLIVALVGRRSPAANAGLKAGDEIVSVDGKDVRGPRSYRYETLTKVPAGTSLTLGLASGASVQIIAGGRP